MKYNLTKRLALYVIILSILSCGSSNQTMVRKLPFNSNPIQSILPIIPKPVPIKCKLYYGETIMIVWYDLNGDDKCDGAILYEKSGDSFIKNILECKQADESDMLLEPRI